MGRWVVAKSLTVDEWMSLMMALYSVLGVIPSWEVLLDALGEPGLKSLLSVVGSGPRRHSDEGVGRMGSAEGACEEL